MGNSPMTIGLKVDTGGNTGGNSITAGSILYGRVYLSVKQEEAAHSIRLKVIGKEEAVVHHTTQEDDDNDHFDNNGRNGSRTSSTRNNYERSTHDIWNVDHPIKEFPNGTIPRGQYEFPFALQLPESLPSSMSSKCGQSTCEVRYEVVAEVFQKPNSMFYTNANAKEELTVVALSSVTSSSPDQDTSLQLPIEIVSINKCCCFSCSRQGTMALETKFNQTTLLLPEHSSSSSSSSSSASTRSTRTRSTRARPNNNNNQNNNDKAAAALFGIQFRCENKSTAKVKSVRAQLIETIEWTVHGQKETIKSVLATSTKDAALYPELDAMWRKPFRWEQHRYGGNNNDNNNDSDSGEYLLLQHKPWRTIEPPLGVPITAKDTYRGRAVQVRHVLTLSLVTEGCCSTNPDVSALVEIYRSPTASTTTAAVAAGGTASHDPLSCEQQQQKQEQQQHYHTPSAPFQDEPAAAATTAATASSTMSQASAPSDHYDDSYAAATAGYKDDDDGVLPNYNDSTSAVIVPMVEAQLVLPEDWSAVTAEVVTIPIAEATVLSSSSSSSTATDGFAGAATGYSK